VAGLIPTRTVAQPVITEFPLPTAGSTPVGITAGPDGNLWFTELTANQIGRITPGGGLTEFPLPTDNSQPAGITAGPDGNLWFTELAVNHMGRITPGGGPPA
jgi:virginiamycin B lyase